MRDLTPFIIQALTPQESDGTLIMEDPMVAFDVTLKDGLNTVMRWATGTLTIDSLNVLGTSTAVGPWDYLPQVRGIPDFKFTLTRAPDGGDFTVQNIDNVVGEMVGGLEAIFNKADVKVYYCFKKPSGTYEADIIFVGRVAGVKGDTKECAFTVVSDMNDKGAVVAGRYLTQRCVAVYKGPQCRYPGPEPTCSLLKEDAVNGCRAKGWEFAFFGANFDINQTTVGQPSTLTPGGLTGGGNGFTYGNGGGGGYVEPDLPIARTTRVAFENT